MPPMLSREIRLASRPRGRPRADNFTLATVTLDSPQDGHVLVRNNYLSVDPCMFCRMRGGKACLPPFKLGKPLEGGAVGTVIESRSQAFDPGDLVISNFGWREGFVTASDAVCPVTRSQHSLSAYLSVFGLQHVCSWASAYLVHVKPGAALLVSGAALVAGSVANQLSNLRDCRIIGSAGSGDMVAFLREDCGFDMAFDYKAGPILAPLCSAPSHFNGTRNESLEAALGVCMAGSFRTKATPGAIGHGAKLPLPIYYLSQPGDPQAST